MNIEKLLNNNMLVKHYAGSIAYGTNIQSSDVDVRGVFCADPINIRTPFFNIKEVVDTKESDTKFYELTNFMKLCIDCNPNIIETLWIDECDILCKTPVYDYLRENRHNLLSSKIAFTTSGYAFSQLKRIKGHNKLINNKKPIDPPRQIDFVKPIQWFEYGMKQKNIDMEYFYDGYRLVPYTKDVFGLVKSEGSKTYSKHDYSLITNINNEKDLSIPIAILKFNKDEYVNENENHKQYWEWKKNRNKSRSELEEQFGYDTKHAMHLVRLLRMGKEALSGEGIIVKRPDAKELLDIRSGSMTYQEIVDYAKEMDDLIRNNLYKKTELRKKPDLKLVAKILMKAQDMIWSESN